MEQIRAGVRGCRRAAGGGGLEIGSTLEGLFSVTLKGIGVGVSEWGVSALWATISSVRISMLSTSASMADLESLWIIQITSKGTQVWVLWPTGGTSSAQTELAWLKSCR